MLDAEQTEGAVVEDPWLQWLLSVVFALTALHSLGLVAASRSATVGVGHALHVVMSIDMVAMCWPWWSGIPALPQGVFFGAASGWFVWRLFRDARRGTASPRSALHLLSHLVMMLVMVWMVVGMGPMVSAGAEPAASAVAAGAPIVAHGHSHGMLGPVAALSGSALVALLIAAGVVFALDAVRRPTGRLHAVANAAMCCGMVAMCWPMMAS